MRALFVTGASGFLGRAFLQGLAEHTDWSVTALTRGTTLAENPRLRVVRADLFDSNTWHPALAGADAVLHLAAVVGKAPMSEHLRVNADGTALLLRACAEAGVPRFLFVSSIAAGYQDKRYYPYAIAKQRAEALVLASELRSTIVRPTIVLGRGSAIGRRLRSLAGLPLLPVFGDGRVRVQPVHVADVAAVLRALLQADRFRQETLDLGGRNVLTMEALLRRLQRALRGRETRAVHLPLQALRSTLAWLDRMAPGVAPISAGQLAAFANDGAAASDAQALAPGHSFATLDAMIAETVQDG